MTTSLPSSYMQFFTSNLSVGLTSVEAPADAKQQFGETKVVTIDDNGVNKYSYEDDYIKIIWSVGNTQLNFTLTNKSSHSLKINWDDISYVNIFGKASRVMHSGVKYAEKNNPQPATTIPKNASISDLLLPIDNVYYVTGQYGGWQEKKLIPTTGKYDSAYIGSHLVVMMPIVIENVQNDYTFTFTVIEVLDNK